MRCVWLVVTLTLVIVASACGSSDNKSASSGTPTQSACGVAASSCGGPTSTAAAIDTTLGRLVFADAHADGTSLGRADAPVTVELWANFLCSHCRDFMYSVLPQVVDSYVKTGDVRLTFRNAAIGSEEAIIAHEAAACANDQGKFWQAVDALYHNFSDNASDYASDKIADRLAGSGVDVTAVASCLSGGTHKAEIEADVSQLNGMNKPALPVLVVNGTVYPGVEDYATARTALDQALNP
jgi:protein-disulfide isomerase